MDVLKQTEATRSGVAAAPGDLEEILRFQLGTAEILFTALVQAGKAGGFLPLITDKTKAQEALLGSMAQEHLLAQTEPLAALGLPEMPTP